MICINHTWFESSCENELIKFISNYLNYIGGAFLIF